MTLRVGTVLFFLGFAQFVKTYIEELSGFRTYRRQYRSWIFCKSVVGQVERNPLCPPGEVQTITHDSSCLFLVFLHFSQHALSKD